MLTEFGFTGEQTDPLNALVYLRARYMNPKLGIFGSLDPFEGDESVPLTMNGYGWVEGNIPNLVDSTGHQSRPPKIEGCSGKSCKTLLDEMYEAIMGVVEEIQQEGGKIKNVVTKGMNLRALEMFDDKCFQFELRFRPDLYPNFAEGTDCFLNNFGGKNAEGKTVKATSYETHKGEYKNNRNALNQAISCYKTEGMQLEFATGDSSRRCPQGHPTYQSALEWQAFDIENIVPAREQERQGLPNGKPTGLPELPPKPSEVHFEFDSQVEITSSSALADAYSNYGNPTTLPNVGVAVGLGTGVIISLALACGAGAQNFSRQRLGR